MKNWWKRGARWHDTSTGTWTSVDPITRLNDPTRANAYLYVGGDPINQFDPAGRFDLGNAVGDALGNAVGWATAGGTAWALGVAGASAGVVAVGAYAAGECAGGVTSEVFDNEASTGNDVIAHCAWNVATGWSKVFS